MALCPGGPTEREASRQPSGDLAREGLKSADHRLDKRVSQMVIGTGQIRPPTGNCKSTIA